MHVRFAEISSFFLCGSVEVHVPQKVDQVVHWSEGQGFDFRLVEVSLGKTLNPKLSTTRFNTEEVLATWNRFAFQNKGEHHLQDVLLQKRLGL